MVLREGLLSSSTSIESLAQLDQILERYHTGIPKGIRTWFSKGPSEEQIGQMAKVWGGYLGETIIKHLGGEWAMSASFHNAIAVKLGDSEVYPPAKVYNRIINGSEDDVNVYFKVLKRDLAG